MRKLISEQLAINVLTAVLSLVIVFHLLVLSGVVPFDIVWGGRISSAAEMQRFELVSIAINAVMLLVVCIRAGFIRIQIAPVILKVAFWLMTILFLLNTIGNLFSQNDFEKLVFTPLTFALMIFSYRLAIS
jgi:hypothetical protein